VYREGEVEIADIQHQDARKLLRIISSALANGSTLTYRKAAELMGREPPQNHSRAIAQMCDLLDAAACLAGVPLLALVKVREEYGEINPKAWKTEYGSRRDEIVKRSLDHSFRDADFEAISSALNGLGHRGNRAAWIFLEGLYPGVLLYRRLTGDYADEDSNAIDDLGTDVPRRSRLEIWSYPRDPRVRDEVLRRAKGRCEFCGAPGFMKPDGSLYLESHHIIALADDGADRITNVIALCPNDHPEAHFGTRAEQIETEMVSKLRIINPEDLP
jgi:5-methylcytosine-specific restriction endonuclease McrA